MTDRDQKVLSLIRAAGGSLTGKVRLQKLVYLLDQLGFGSSFHFEYHHYGPFSRDLVNAVEDAKAFGLIEEEILRRSFDYAPYSIFKALKEDYDPHAFGQLGEARTHTLLASLSSQDATVLELAATAHWLWKFEGRADWREELAKRKGVKVQEGRLDRAVNLLRGLELGPPENASI